MNAKKALLAVIALPFMLGLAGCDEDEWDNPFGEETHLVVSNNTSEDVFVEIDQHQNGQIRTLGTVPAGQIAKWRVDTGWAWLFVDNDAIEIYLDDEYDGWFEINE